MGIKEGACMEIINALVKNKIHNKLFLAKPKA